MCEYFYAGIKSSKFEFSRAKNYYKNFVAGDDDDGKTENNLIAVKNSISARIVRHVLLCCGNFKIEFPWLNFYKYICISNGVLRASMHFI